MKKTSENGNEYDFFLKKPGIITPPHLFRTIKDRMNGYTNPPMERVIFKYVSVFIVTGFISLFLCPQKGVGFLENNYPLFFHTLHSRKFLCGLYCGSFFLAITHITTLLVLSHYERLKIFTTLWNLPRILFSLFFGGFMLVSDDLYKFNFFYNLSWLLVVIVGMQLTKKVFFLKTA